MSAESEIDRHRAAVIGALWAVAKAARECYTAWSLGGRELREVLDALDTLASNPRSTRTPMKLFEQSSVQRGDKGWAVLVNGFVRGIFPYGPWGEADANLFAEALDLLGENPGAGLAPNGDD